MAIRKQRCRVIRRTQDHSQIPQSRCAAPARNLSRWALLAGGFIAIATLNAPPVLAQSGSRAERAWQQGSMLYDHQDYRHALTAYQEAAGLGDPRAMTVLGKMYREGQGVAVDKKQAAQWYERAAAGGSRGARFALGDMLESGEGIPRNVARAAQLYEQSARQGFPEAQFALGISYEFGQGVPRSRSTAIQWLDKAAAQGDGRAHWYSSWLQASATPQFDNPDRLRDYVNGQVDARMRLQMGAGNSNCSMVPWVCSRERAEALWKSEYHPPNTPNPYRN
jgi:TPR repeat protein